MDDVWRRAAKKIGTFPDGKGREVAWLAEKLECSQQRVFNWIARGVPAKAHAELAHALGMSVGELIGADEPAAAWPFETIRPERFTALTPMQRAMVELAALHEIERIEAATGKRQRAA